MATEELLIEHFNFLGIEVEGEVLIRCVELCREYNIDPEAFVEQWMAFSLSHLKAAPPSLDKLNLLERKELSKEHDNSSVLGKEKISGDKQLPIYNNVSQVEQETIYDYVPSTPKRNKVEGKTLNESSVELSPATYSQSSTHSLKYSSRTNAGTILMNFGSEELLKTMTEPGHINASHSLNIGQIPNEDGELLAVKAMFGFELLHEKASIYDSHIQYLSSCILQKIGVSQTSSVRCKSQTPIYVAGRIECDADAKLNPQSVILQGTWEESLSQSVPLDISHLKQYSLFPGQVVVVKGTNPRGDKFITEEIYTDASLPVQPRNIDISNYFEGNMTIMVAAGPFTPSDSLQYEPLKDFISQIVKQRPHLVILLGPYLDEEHAMIKENVLAETYRSFFEKLLESIDDITSQSPYTKIAMVSSAKDAFNVNVYPTPAFSSKRKHPNMTFLPDPCMLNVNGVNMLLSATDVLIYLSQQEISIGPQTDKLSRLASCILSQRCVLPSFATPKVPMDATLWSAHAHLNQSPHVAILPSLFRYQVKDVNGCIVINPERLTKGSGGGTFARIAIDFEDGNVKDITNNIAVQIVRI